MGETMRFRVGKNVPWLKFGVLFAVVFIVTVGVEGTFRYLETGEVAVVPLAPMSVQAEVPDKIFRRKIEGKMLVALTFDDGPSAATTPRLLDILKEKEVVATFFELGGKVRNNPEITQRADREGHEIGSHTMYHQNLIRISRAAVEADVWEAKGVFREVIGRETVLTRAPYGNSNVVVAGIIGTPLIYWTVDTRDWEVLDTGRVVENAIGAASDGAIILMHDIYGTTVDAVPAIIDGLRERGYEFVTVSELAKVRGVELQSGVVYYSFKP